MLEQSNHMLKQRNSTPAVGMTKTCKRIHTFNTVTARTTLRLLALESFGPTGDPGVTSRATEDSFTYPIDAATKDAISLSFFDLIVFDTLRGAWSNTDTRWRCNYLLYNTLSTRDTHQEAHMKRHPTGVEKLCKQEHLMTSART